MIVPTSSTRSVRTAPDDAAFRDACVSGSGDMASPEPLGAAVYRIQKLLMRHPPTRVRWRRALVSLPGLSQPTPCGQCRGGGKGHVRAARWDRLTVRMG